MKKIIFISILIISIIVIYNNNIKKSTMILSFGNNYQSKYSYLYNDTRITDITNDINRNIELNNKKIQHILIKADIIYIDLNGLFRYDGYNKIIVNNKDLTNLVELIRKYCKENIKIKLLEEANEYAIYANKKIILSLEKYDIMFVR